MWSLPSDLRIFRNSNAGMERTNKKNTKSSASADFQFGMLSAVAYYYYKYCAFGRFIYLFILAVAVVTR